ncbi:gag polyprotein [Fusarium flagelliforme]|uniref:Gag polyprotein n=1 Tax=Fusarium flagelliforme TaxID=2675880 RepID=A0A395M8F5_9HYPO|nr:gag polyprotein [Fusarium flagelliforme]
MAPATPNRPSTAQRGQQPPQATPPGTNPTLEEELDLPMDTGDEGEDDIAPAHPSSHEDEVAKLKRRLRDLNKRHDELLNAAKFNSEVAKNKIEDLEAKVAHVTNLAEGLGKEAEKSQNLYREHIEHTAALAANGKDPGEILRPRQPDPYGGESDKLQGFLTSLRSYQMYYPTQFSTDELRVQHAMSFLKDKAQRVMEPILRDYVHNPPYARKQMTTYVYEKYEHFEKELTHAFGIADEKREAEAKIRQLVQKGSASTYLAEYRFQAAKLDWNEAAHMSQVYRGLKPDVKDAMVYAREKPKTLDELASLAVDIDNQLFERRKEKQANKQGQAYTPNWNKNQQSSNRNYANQGRQRQANTSYGTQAGPMNVNATQSNRPAPTCWNCGKKGHQERDCRNPVKTNQKYRPVPEGKTARRTNTQEEEEPQMAVRTSKRAAMTRSGYDVDTQDNSRARQAAHEKSIDEAIEYRKQEQARMQAEEEHQRQLALKRKKAKKKYDSKPENRAKANNRQQERRRQEKQ